MRIIQRLIALILAICGIISCLSGCGSESDPAPGLDANRSQEDVTTSKAMGRYVQESISIPECTFVEDMVMLPDGRLRFVDLDWAGNGTVYTGSPDGSGWESKPLPDEIQGSGYISALALSAGGEIFCSVACEADEPGTYEFHSWLIDSAGDCREIPISHPDEDPQSIFLITDCDFTGDGTLMASFFNREIRQIDLETGALSEDYNEFGIYIGMGAFECAGENTYAMNTSEGMIYSNGKSELLSGVVGEQLIGSLKAFEGMDKTKTTLWQNADGYLFFTTHEGLFSYVPGGSVTEELVSGARTSLGDPTFFSSALVGEEGGAFYVAGNYSSGGSALFRYVYDPDIPTVPETHLRIYSLYADEDLQQMISQYQIAHPEVAIDLQIGVTGEDGVTESDALRTLNTQILAGDGPDLLRLDGFSLDAYLEKDLLLDLSDILTQTDPLLQQVTHCYAADGKVCAVPTCFAIPSIYGPGELVSQVRDLDSLYTAAIQAQADRPQSRTVLLGLIPKMFADQYYDSCSSAWIKPDNTLDEEKLAEFYEDIQSLYTIDASARAEMEDMLAAMREDTYVPGEHTNIGSAVNIVEGTLCMTVGTLTGMDYWAFVLAGDDYLDGYELVPLNGQSSNVFLPRRIMGILSSSTQQEAAGDFLGFMLSDDVQSKDLTTGFPVNKTTFDREIREDRTSTSTMSGMDAEGNYMSFNFKYPEAYRRQELKTWVDNLTTPALTDRIIRNTVMAQMESCLDGKITPQEAARNALQELNLYLSE